MGSVKGVPKKSGPLSYEVESVTAEVNQMQSSHRCITHWACILTLGASTMPDILVWQDSHLLSFKSSCLYLVARTHFNAMGICGNWACNIPKKPVVEMGLLGYGAAHQSTSFSSSRHSQKS